ncbi:phage tail assembly chaperone [Ancylobacter pratisalsi]|uniref:phage tail assembly chaperone n=1 Tax=Ancylobacter pratisalsi TaxID=1745854 RepID=UPI003CCCFCDE
MPWRRWQQFAFGALGWPPAVFWAATLNEFFAAHDGWCEVNGIKKRIDPPSRERLEELQRRYG